MTTIQISTGRKWPPPDTETQTRLNRYALMDSLYSGDRARWRMLRTTLDAQYSRLNFKKTGAPKLDDEARASDLVSSLQSVRKHYLMWNLIRFITEKLQQLIFNKPVRLKSLTENRDANHATNRLIRDTKIREIGQKIIKSLLVNGDSVIKLRTGMRPQYKDSEEQVLIDVVPAEFYYPEFEPGSDYDVTAVNIAFIKTLMIAENEENFLLVEHHEPGEISYQVWKMDGDTIGEWVEIGRAHV